MPFFKGKMTSDNYSENLFFFSINLFLLIFTSLNKDSEKYTYFFFFNITLFLLEMKRIYSKIHIDSNSYYPQ